MTPKIWFLAGLSCLFPALAAGQSPTGQNQLFKSSQGKPGLFSSRSNQPESSSSQKMYEDIEIMRRILNRKIGLWPGLLAMNARCTTCHVPSLDFAKNSEGRFVAAGDFEFLNSIEYQVPINQPDAAAALGVAHSESHPVWADTLTIAQNPHASLVVSTNIEGAYLKGEGVVYALTLPPPSPSRPAATKKTYVRPLNDWDRARQSVRGDEPQPQPSEPAKQSKESGILAELEKSGHLDIADTILKILAENGHHFSQLGPSEKITVVVTFRQATRSIASQGQSGSQQTNPLNAWGNQPDIPTTWEADTNRALNVQPGIYANQMGSRVPGAGWDASTSGAGSPHTPASVRDFELLGDMHLKQNKAQEAIKAFQRALNLSPPPKYAATLYRKVAQANLMMEDDAAAKKALEMAAENLKMAGETIKNSGSSASGTAAKENPTASLPAKLIIAAPKGMLDQVAAGKMTYNDFRRHGSIEFIGSISNPAANTNK